MFANLYKRLLRWAHSKHFLYGITLASFLESIIVPIPIETLLIPVSQIRRDKVWWIATMATLGCIVGALIAYVIGMWFFDTYSTQILSLLNDPNRFEEIQTRMHDEGFWFIVLAGIAPIPLQLAMLAAGVSHYPIGLYILAIAISRIIRYFGIAWLVLRYGDQTEALFRQYQWKAVTVLSGIIIVLWIAKFTLF